MIAPNNWKRLSLEEISTKIMVGIASSATHAYREDGVILLRNLNIKENHINDSDILYIDQDYEIQHRRKRLKTGDVITVRTGYPGVSAVVTKKFDGAQCFTSLITRPIQRQVNSNYLCYYINSDSGQRFITSAEAGGAQKNVNVSVLSKMPILLPPLAEQEKIVEILSTWDEAIRLTQELIAAKEQRKKGLMQRLLTGQVRFDGFEKRPGKQETRFGQLPVDWQYVQVSEIAYQVSKKNVENKDLTVLSCTKYDGLVDSLEYFGRQIFSKNTSTYKVVKREQFAYATNHIEEGSIGYQNLYDEALISPMYTVFETNDRVNDSFLFRVLKTELYRHIFEINTNGTVNRRGSLRWPAFSKIRIPLPSLQEQKRIADFFDANDHEIQLLQQKLAALQQQKKGLMQRLLTGRVRVPLDKLIPILALTPVQAFIIGLIALYQPRKHKHLTSKEIQKLVYFAQEEAGVSLDHDFFDWDYGPYSKTLQEQLSSMDGSLISGVNAGERHERKEIIPLPEAAAAATAYFDQNPTAQTQLDYALKLVKGFETPRRIELLATVHRVMHTNPVASFNDIVRGVHQWNEHKKGFRKGQIREAWEHLRQFDRMELPDEHSPSVQGRN